MKSHHPHENMVYFNLPSGNKSISSFWRRNCKSATLLHKDVMALFEEILTSFKDSRFSLQWGHLRASLYSPPPKHPEHLAFNVYTTFVIALRFTNKIVGKGKPVVGRTDHP